MDKKDNKISLNSPGYLIELDFHRVSKLKFKNDVLIEKLALTLSESDEIIKHEKFSKIMK